MKEAINKAKRFFWRLIIPRTTLELEDLNFLWERFNNGEDVEFEVVSREWKYQNDKAVMLLQFHDLRKTIPPLSHPEEDKK